MLDRSRKTDSLIRKPDPNTVSGEESEVIESGKSIEPTMDAEIRAAAAILGRRGGLKGGKARAKVLSPEQRSEIARKAADARWSRTRQGDKSNE